MKLATVRTHEGTTAARIEGNRWAALPAADVGALVRDPAWRIAVESAVPATPLTDAVLARPVLHPGKVICVGLNYREHILEMGRELPAFPTLFAKFADALVGPGEDIVLPQASSAMDWEGELALVIGAPVRDADADEAEAAILGYTVLNDVTARDYQYRTTQWLQGKTFEASTPVGPVVVTPDELPAGARIVTEVDGEVVQDATIDGLVFGPVDLVAYVSRIITLRPGDILATGTPAGVGHSHTPPRYLSPGARVTVSIEGIGALDNRCRVA